MSNMTQYMEYESTPTYHYAYTLGWFGGPIFQVVELVTECDGSLSQSNLAVFLPVFLRTRSVRKRGTRSVGIRGTWSIP